MYYLRPKKYREIKFVHSILPNRILEQNSQEKDFIFIDLYSSFNDTNGNLKLEFGEKDGLHLNAHGYKLWSDILKGNILQSQ